MITSSEACAKWTELADREALGESLLPEETAELRAHEVTCQACSQEAAAFRSLSTGALEAVPNDDQIDQILRAADLRPATSSDRPAARKTRGRGAVAAALASLAAAAATWFVVHERPAVPAAPQLAQVHPSEPRAVNRALATPAAPASEPSRWATAEAPSCRVFLEDITVCLDAHTEALTDGLVGNHARLELVRGHAIASLPTRAPGSSFAIQGPFGTVTAVGTIFSVELGAQGPAVARVLRGEVAVQAIGAMAARSLRAGESTAVDAESAVVALTPEERRRELSLLPIQTPNQERQLSKGDRPKAATTEDDPFARARLLRGHGRFAEAAELYESIHAANPQSASGRAALLGLAELRLSDLHDATGALRAFDTYLAGGQDALSREAAYGRIRALRALGKKDQERSAIVAFIRTYPNGPEAETLRGRLSDLRGP